MSFVGGEGVVGGIYGVDRCGNVREVEREPGDVFFWEVAGDDAEGGNLVWWVRGAVVEEGGVEEWALVRDCDGYFRVVEEARDEWWNEKIRC